MISPRAKYQCNPKLEQYIELVNIVPADFDFEWSAFEDQIGNNPKFKSWVSKLLELSPKQTIKLLTAEIDNIRFPLDENFSDRHSSKDVIKFGGIVLVQFIKIKSIRSFLHNLIRLNKLSNESRIKDLLKNQSIFETLHLLHSNIEELFRLSAAQKIYKTLKPDLINLEKRKMMGIVIQYTSHFIGTENTEQFNLTEDEKLEFLAKWAMSIKEKIPDLEDYSPTLKNFDLLVQSQLEFENRISNVKASIDKDGNVHFELNDYAKSLEGVNISRLRLCEYCQKVFWANRKDAFTCSPKHARNRRMRLLRENWKEKGDLYLNARKKKAKKKKEKKENGSL